MQSPILVVDDEGPIRDMVCKFLNRLDYDCLTAVDGKDGFETLKRNDNCKIVLSDLCMPKMDGLSFIEKARNEIDRNLEFIVLTGNGEKADVVAALRLGVCEFLDKPMCMSDLMDAIDKAAAALQEKNKNERLLDQAMTQGRQQMEQIFALKNALEGSTEDQVQHLARVAQYRDIETAAHCKRVGLYACKLAELTGHEWAFSKNILRAAILHDIGKVGISDKVLKKAGPLTAEEYDEMKTHTEIGARMLEGSSNEVVKMATEIARTHHEYYDGTGYPNGLSGNDIPIAGRLTCLADIYDALRSKRCYKEPFSHEKAVKIILEGDGRTKPEHFDPEILEAFRSNHLFFAEIFASLPDVDGPFLQPEAELA